MNQSVRIAKAIAGAGVTSRRKAETYVTAGRVQINGQTVTDLGHKVDLENDIVSVDGAALTLQVPAMTLALHKPTGYISAMQAQDDRLTLADLLPEKYQHLFHIGRLDYDSAGLLLLTNDGKLAQLVAHPKFELTKIYYCQVAPAPNKTQVQRLLKGVKLFDGMSKFDQLRILQASQNEALLEVALHSGKNRIIRRTLAAQKIKVRELTRMQIGPIKLGDLKVGKWRVLSQIEIDSLKKSADGSRR
ncbi:MAG: rRNA pseudouridine synthase [Bifidobacteriaceae bacterium]|nr:rRNA pseudouridine synthase [Bifidobacteriaceae bacterium]